MINFLPEIGDIFKRNNNYDGKFYNNYIVVVYSIRDGVIRFRQENNLNDVSHGFGSFIIHEFYDKFDRIIYD